MKKIVTLCFSAGIQKTIEFSKIQLDKVNRSKNYRFDIAGKAVNSARVLTQLAKIYEKNLSELSFCSLKVTSRYITEWPVVEIFCNPSQVHKRNMHLRRIVFFIDKN